MRRWLTFILLCLLPFAAAAEDVAVPALTARVTDLTGTLSAEQKSTLEARLLALETQKGSQIAVLLVPTMHSPFSLSKHPNRLFPVARISRSKVRCRTIDGADTLQDYDTSNCRNAS